MLAKKSGNIINMASVASSIKGKGSFTELTAHASITNILLN